MTLRSQLVLQLDIRGISCNSHKCRYKVAPTSVTLALSGDANGVSLKGGYFRHKSEPS